MRPKTLPSRIQERLSHIYGIDDAPSVDDFIHPTDGSEREVLLLRDADDGIEVALHLPRRALDAEPSLSFDDICQVVEGVSHFLYVVERARRELPATHLELELQAEIDKYIVLAHGGRVGGRTFEPDRACRIRARLFERVTFAHPAGTESGDRYRIANDVAARFAGRLEEVFARHGRFEQMRLLLRRFYWAGQTQKLELAHAA